MSFTQPVVLSAADVTLGSARGFQYGPVTITGIGISHTIMFAEPVDKADRVTLSITIPQTDALTGRLNVLPGDVDDYGVVSIKDLAAIHDAYKGKHGAKPTMFDNVFGNGTVSSSNYKLLMEDRGTRLPRLAPMTPKTADVHSDARRLDGHCLAPAPS